MMWKFHPLVFIIIIAFIVRFIGLSFGLPFRYHDDEPIIVNYALSYGTGDFNPRMFNVPPLLSYLLFFEYGIFYLIGSLLGFFKDINDFGYLYLNDPTIFHMIGRVTFGIVPGVLSVLFLYQLGKKIFNEHIGLIAAFFLAINFLHVRDSHYLYFDVPLTMCLIVFFVKSVDLIYTNSIRDYVWTGALIGVVTGIKYFGPLLTPFLIAILMHNFIFYRKETLWNIQKTGVLILMSVITFFILNPFAFLEYERFWRTLTRLSVNEQEIWFHFNVSLTGSLGLLMLCCGLIGGCIAVIKRNKAAWLLSIFVVSYYIIIVMNSQKAERYVMPLVPLLILFAGYFTYSLLEYVRKPLARKVVFISISCLLVFPSAYKVFLTDKLFWACDTRTQAYRWIKQNVSPNAIIAMDATSSCFPRLEKSKEQVKEAYDDSREITFKPPSRSLDFKRQLMLSNPRYSEVTYTLHYMRETTIRGFHSVYPDMLIDFEELKQRNVEYVILSNVLRDDRYNEFVKKLRKKFRLLESFSPYEEHVRRIKPEENTGLPAAAFSMKELKDRKSFGSYIEIYRML